MISLEDVAARIGVARAYVVRLECGRIDLPLTVAARLANVLGISIAELAGEDPNGREVEEWRRLALQVSRVFFDGDGAPTSGASATRDLASLIACYMRIGHKRRASGRTGRG